ncbi:MAG TPA: alpha/beta hydrolase [Acidimicrobiia bacterium]|nr:alpha/beta hydrolase [Acidimicrobiia bacterium]
MQDIRIPVPGGDINVWQRPAKPGQPTAVLVHGLTGTSRWWTRVVDHLPSGMGVAALDVRGRGASSETPPPYDAASIAEDMARTMDRLGLDTAIVVGYSMGGWIVSVFDERYPKRADRLLLVDGGLALPPHPSGDPDQAIEAVVGPSLARLDTTFSSREAFYDYWKAHPALERYWDDSMRDALDFELVESSDGFVVRANSEAIRTSAREITVDPATNEAGTRVTSPSLLIVVERGTADQPGGMMPLATAEAAAAANPNLEMLYLEDLNHYTLVLGEGASRVAAAIASG